MALGRYLTVGLTCALLHNAIMIAGDAGGLHYFTSSVISLVIVTSFGYWLHSRWTFPGAERSAASYTRYFVTIAANFPLSLLGLLVLVDLLGIPVPISAPLVTVLLFAFNWVANRWALRVWR